MLENKEYSPLEILYRYLLEKTETDSIEKMCCGIDDYDSNLTDDVVLTATGFEEVSSEQISDFVQECYMWSKRCDHIKIILFIPKNKCVFYFQDASKIKIKDLKKSCEKY